MFCAFSLCTQLLVSCLESSCKKKQPPQITSSQVLLFRLFSLRAFSYCAEDSLNFVLRILFMHPVTYVVLGDDFLQKKQPPQIASIAVFSYFTYFHSALSPIAHKTPFPLCINFIHALKQMVIHFQHCLRILKGIVSRKILVLQPA